MSLPPETDAVQVIVGYLSDGHPHWTFLIEHDRGSIVDLQFAVKATALGREIVRRPEDEGNELGLGERAAQKFDSRAEVTRGRFVGHDPCFFGSFFGYVLVRITVRNVPD